MKLPSSREFNQSYLKFAPGELPQEPTQVGEMDDFQEDDFIEERNHEALLQKVNIPKELGLVGTNVALDAAGVGTVYDALKNNPLSAMTEFGASLAGHKRPFEGVLPNIPQPETGLGKAAVLGASLLPIGYGVIKGGKALAGGLKGIFGLKQPTKALASSLSETIPYAEQVIAREGASASEAFGKTIQDIADTGIKHADIDSWLDKLIDVIDPKRTSLLDITSDASKINALKGQWGGLHGNPPPLSGAQFQARIDTLKQALGAIGSKAQGAFSPIMKEGLSKTSAGRYFRMGQETYGASKKSRDIVEQLTKKPFLNKLAKGTIESKELRQLRTEAQKYPGLDAFVEDIIKQGEKIRKVKSARALAKRAGYTGLGITGLNFLRSLMSGGNVQNITNIMSGE